MSVMIRSAYGPKSREVFASDKPTRTKASHAAECDVNNIIKRYPNPALIPPLSTAIARYMDTVGVSDYQASLNAVMAAEQSFMALPSAIRRLCDNDPARFLVFVQDPKNRDVLVEHGLITPKEAFERAQHSDEVTQPEVPTEAPKGPKNGRTAARTQQLDLEDPK